MDQGSSILWFWKYSNRKSLSNNVLKKLFSEQCKKQGQEDTDQNGGNNGKVESEVLFSDDDVSGKSPDPRNFLPDHQEDADEDDKDAQQDEHFT